MSFLKFFFCLGLTLACNVVFATSIKSLTLKKNISFGSPITTVAFHAAHRGEVFAAGKNRGLFPGENSVLFQSTDNGQTWIRNSTHLFDEIEITDILFNPRDDNEIYLATFKGIFKSANHGATWQSIFPDKVFLSLTINPQNPQEIYAAGTYGAFKTIDGGRTWIKLHGFGRQLNFIKIAVNPLNPNMVLLNTIEHSKYTGQLWLSLDKGLSWQHIQIGDAYLYRTAFSPVNPMQIYTAGKGGVFVSYNAGQNWQLLFRPKQTDHFLCEIRINQNNPREIYIQVEHEGIYRSDDAGQSWKLINQVTVDETLTTIALDPNPSSATIFFTSEQHGLMKSNDHGQTWMQSGDGIFNADRLPVTITQ